jgi:hypothetical protein
LNGGWFVVINSEDFSSDSINRNELQRQLRHVIDELLFTDPERTWEISEYAQTLLYELENYNPSNLSILNEKVQQIKGCLAQDKSYRDYQKISNCYQKLYPPFSTKIAIDKKPVQHSLYRLTSLLPTLQAHKINPQDSKIKSFEVIAELIKKFHEINLPPCDIKFKQQCDIFFDLSLKIELLLFMKCEEALPVFRNTFKKKILPMKSAFDDEVDALHAKLVLFQRQGDPLSKEKRAEAKYFISKIQRLLESNKRIISLFPPSHELNEIKRFNDDYSLLLEKTLSAKERIESDLFSLRTLLQESDKTKPIEWLIHEFKIINFPPPDPEFEEECKAFFSAVQEMEAILSQQDLNSLYRFREVVKEKLIKGTLEKDAHILYEEVRDISSKNFHKLSKEERVKLKNCIEKTQKFLDGNKEIISLIPSFPALEKLKEFTDSYSFYQFSKLPFSADGKVSELITLPHHIGGEGLKFLTPLQQIMVGETFGPQYHGRAIRNLVHDLNRGKLKLSEKNLAFLLRRVNGYNERLAIEKKEAVKNNKQATSELPIQLHTLDLTGYDPIKVNHILTLCPDLKTLKYHRANMEQVNLSNAPNLLEVDLSYAKNLSLQHLQALKNVTSLTLCEVELPNEADFSGMTHLVLLKLNRGFSSLSAEVVAKIIASISNTVEELNLEGFDCSLSNLLRFTKLKTLYVGRTRTQLHSQNGKVFSQSVKHLHLGNYGDFTNLMLQDLALDSLFWRSGSKLNAKQIRQIQGLKELYIKSIWNAEDTNLSECKSLTKLSFEGFIAIKPQSLPPQLQQIIFFHSYDKTHVSHDLDFSACENLQSAVFNNVANAPSSKIEWLLEHSKSVELLNKTEVEKVNFSCIAPGSKLNTLILDDVTLTKEQMGQLEQIQKQFGSTIKIEIRNCKIS